MFLIVNFPASVSGNFLCKVSSITLWSEEISLPANVLLLTRSMTWDACNYLYSSETAKFSKSSPRSPSVSMSSFCIRSTVKSAFCSGEARLSFKTYSSKSFEPALLFNSLTKASPMLSTKSLSIPLISSSRAAS